MLGFRADPGDCLICGTAHCACGGPVVLRLLPQRDAMPAEVQSIEPPADLAPPVECDPPPPSFSTAEYKRAIHGPKKARR
ncbi:MAG TPA: hypothetical protein VGQ44_01480 [Gemmatimonadaceae bacterium]|jgi:hypothetical protein|nr:hypothetical protein [Gemmatimonadaceae bacterium]